MTKGASVDGAPKQVITDMDVVAAMADIVAEVGPDFRYETRRNEVTKLQTCFYVYQGKPDCLVGRILHKLGMSLEALQEWEFIGADVMLDSTTPSESGVPETTRNAKRLLVRAQFDSDAGTSWSSILLRARQLVATTQTQNTGVVY